MIPMKHLSVSEENFKKIINLFNNLFEKLPYSARNLNIKKYLYTYQTGDGENITIELEHLDGSFYHGPEYNLYFGMNYFPNTISFEEFLELVNKSVKRTLLFNLNLFL